MAIDETVLHGLITDLSSELDEAQIKKNKLRNILTLANSIIMTPRTEIVPAIPTVFEEDGTTIKTAAVPEHTTEVYDVMPIDKDLGTTITESRRQGLYDKVISEKESLLNS